MSDTVSMEQYRHEREEIAKLLASQGGQALLRRLRRSWDTGDLMGKDPYQTAYNVGKRDALREVEAMAEPIERKA